MIESHEGGGFGVSGRRDMDLFRLNYIRRGLEFEIKCPGMRLTSKAPKCSTICRREFGFKGRPPKLLAQLVRLIEQMEARRDATPEGERIEVPETPR